MDVSAVHYGKEKSKKGNDKGKWKDKDNEDAANPDAEVICYSCYCKRTQEARLSDHGEGETQEGAARERSRTGTRSRATPSSTQVTTPARISMIEMNSHG